MTRRVPLAVLLLTSAAPLPAFAQETAAAATTTAQPIDDLPEEEVEGEEIVVMGQKPRGSVVGDIPPENVLNPRDIRATGAADLTSYKRVPADFANRIPDSLKTLLEFPGYTADNMTKLKQSYAAIGAAPEHLRYGWIRRTA